jgi:hypothetical protein
MATLSPFMMLVLEDEIQRLRPSILIRFNNQRPSYLKKDVTLQTELIRLRAPVAGTAAVQK